MILTNIQQMGRKVFTETQVDDAVSDISAALNEMFDNCAHVGSSYIVGEGADLDLVVLVTPGDLDEACAKLEDHAYTFTTSKDCSGAEDEFRTFRKGDVNVMLSDDEKWYYAFKQAAEVCRALQLREKWQRIAVHRVIMNNEDAETAARTAKENTQ